MRFSVLNIIHQFFRRLREDNSRVGGVIWPNFELIKALMLASSPARMKMIQSRRKELEWSQNFSNYKYTGILPDAQGQLTPQAIVSSGRISNSFEMLWLSSFPEGIKKVQLKIKTLECSQHYILIFQTLKDRKLLIR